MSIDTHLLGSGVHAGAEAIDDPVDLVVELLDGVVHLHVRVLVVVEPDRGAHPCQPMRRAQQSGIHTSLSLLMGRATTRAYQRSSS